MIIKINTKDKIIRVDNTYYDYISYSILNKELVIYNNGKTLIPLPFSYKIYKNTTLINVGHNGTLYSYNVLRSNNRCRAIKEVVGK